MDGTAAGPPRVTVPGRLDRRLRLGPFPTGRDALKFLAYTALGVSLAPSSVPLLGAPLILVGFVVAVYKPDGQAIDERLVVFLRYALRRRRSGASPVSRRARARIGEGSLLTLDDGRSASVVRTAGTPLAYLPSEELARRFDLFRGLLRSVEGELWLRADSVPIFREAVTPAGPSLTTAEEPARAGYSELVALLCRRRAVRRVHVVLLAGAASLDAVPRLEAVTHAVLTHLAALGLRAERLHGRDLRDAASRLGLEGVLLR